MLIISLGFISKFTCWENTKTKQS